ncbi:amine oxidase [Leptolyngbya sp. Heron Island J]|uniref:flavin monoamine oxidase family protein n=1 Tax=Leptolyngbya sp. Heron Island J TaxID=1385935 RepID=UPI0003B98187|nr:NAD(P)/FAD-dependent oxidoreductase [Leptolyngbya sp. Heron Island J]ESA32063.1 amine oxidase [Leptolyngbya sp. Heron Island J]
MRTISRRLMMSLLAALPCLGRKRNPVVAPDQTDQTHYDTIVIGAGAAGLAAARTLQDANHSVLLLEARDRIGGRVNTNYDFAAHPVESGAEYLPGENIITWDWVRRYRLATLPVFARYRHQFMYVNQELLPFRRWSTIPGMEILELMDDSPIDELIAAWIDAGKPDISLAQFLSLHKVELSADVRRIVDHFLSGSYAANLEQLGVYGLVELTYAGDGDRYFRISKGYSHLLEQFADGLHIRYATPVTRIQWSSSGIQIHTETDTIYTAQQIVITLPLALLQENAVEFAPKLPEDKLNAIQGLGTGHITKLMLKFDQPFWSKDLESCLTTLDTQLWWRPGWKRHNETPVLTAFTGATGADQLGSLGREGAIQAGLQDLEQMFEMPLADRLIDALFVDWQADPYARMAYSYVPVNGVGLRSQLAQPVDQVLFFAGEATHPTRAATVHGALESGMRAAHEILSFSTSRAARGLHKNQVPG